MAALGAEWRAKKLGFALRANNRRRHAPTRGFAFGLEVTNVRKFPQYFRSDRRAEPRPYIRKYSELTVLVPDAVHGGLRPERSEGAPKAQ